MRLQKLLVLGSVGFVVLVTNGILMADAGKSQTTWVNFLKPKGQPGPELTLSSAGKTDYVILLPGEATTQEKKAASELALHLKQITQVTFPEVSEGKEKQSPSAKVISIGQTELWKNTQLAEKTVDLSDEGYAITVKRNNLFLFGGKMRGPLCAVFALLEEDLGVRWYSTDFTYIPQIPDLRFRPMPRTYVPQFELRQPLIKETDNETWALRNRVNSQYRFGFIRQEWGGSIPMPNKYFVHTFDTLVPRAKYFKDHPEYFSMRDSKRNSFQLCASNPQVAKIIISELLSQVKTGREIFSVSPNDGGAYCECPACKALNDAQESGGAAHLRLVNKVAAGLAEKYPQVRISHLAYLGADVAPKTIRPHKNVIVQFCTDYDSWKWPFIPYSQTKVTQERLKGWIDIGANVYVWDYWTNFSYPILPFPNMMVVADNLRFFAQNNVRGIFMEGAQNYGSNNAALRAWVWSKLLWDPNLDSQKLTRDFTYGYYGPAAEPMQQYNELLDQIYLKNIPRFQAEYKIGYEALYNIRFDSSVVFLSKRPYLNEATTLFAQAEKLAADSPDPNLLRRVKIAKLPFLYTKLCRGPGYRNFNTYSFYESKDKYLEMINEFESIVKKENITIVRDGRWDRYPVGADIEDNLANWRKLLTDAKGE